MLLLLTEFKALLAYSELNYITTHDASSISGTGEVLEAGDLDL